MPLIDTISRDIAEAMRAKDQVRLGALRLAKAALVNREVEKGRALEEAEAQQVMASLLKQRRDSVEQFTKFGRDELARREQAEIAVLEAYVPPAASQEDVDRAIAEAIAETGAASPKDVGKVMKTVMPKLAGRTVDGKTVNELVRRKLGS